ncbi:thioredoxin [Desulfovibrio legallii]|uniref:Thioredoxin n=1 Tax=Desulfovibrio legallii TaxID=571438 RepID=A0A6H3FBH9_9BACT|nr:thioredoxin [Desulfovibrio legallii]RHH22168.1 thioredoxin [Desulfovibrio sp. AM18-2]TBH80524.1 thioredoxin [Desulfovibrio legallii]
MDATIIAALVLFLAFIIFDARRRTAQQLRLIAEEKSGIAVASGMTASIGVFYPDVRTTVVMGASEDTGICYYRVLRDGKVINRSKISLGNIDRVDLLVNGTAYRLQVDSCQATSFLKATDVAGRCMSLFSPAQLQAVQRAGLRLVFRDEGGAQKALDITVLRMGDERHRFKRMELFKDAVWWRTFLESAGAQARHDAVPPEQAPQLEPGEKSL